MTSTEKSVKSAPFLTKDDSVNLLNSYVVPLSTLLSVLLSADNHMHASDKLLRLNNTLFGMHTNSGLAFELAGMIALRSDLTLTPLVSLTTVQRALVDAIKSEGWHIRFVRGINRLVCMHSESSTIYNMG